MKNAPLPLMNRFAYLGVAVMTSLLFSSLPLKANATDAGNNEILIGEYASLTGDKATFGVSYTNGFQMAVDEINQAGGLLGKKIKVVLEDDQSKPGQPSAIVRKLISNNKVVAIIGEYSSSLSLEAAPICQAAHVPMLSPGATNPAVTEKGDYIFRDCFVDTFQGMAMAKFALDHLKLKNVAVLTAVNQDASIGQAQFFKDYFTNHGGKIVAEQSYNTGDKDFRAQLTAIKASKADAVFAPGYYTEAGLIARQMRALGIRTPFLGCDGWDSPKLTEIGGSAVNGTYFSTHFSPEDTSPLIQSFVAKYKAKFNAMPDSTAVLGYDAGLLLADAIKRANSTKGQAIRDSLAATKDCQVTTGKINFDANRNAIKPAVIVEVKNGKACYLDTVNP